MIIPEEHTAPAYDERADFTPFVILHYILFFSPKEWAHSSTPMESTFSGNRIRNGFPRKDVKSDSQSHRFRDLRASLPSHH